MKAFSGCSWLFPLSDLSIKLLPLATYSFRALMTVTQMFRNACLVFGFQSGYSVGLQEVLMVVYNQNEATLHYLVSWFMFMSMVPFYGYQWRMLRCYFGANLALVFRVICRMNSGENLWVNDYGSIWIVSCFGDICRLLPFSS